MQVEEEEDAEDENDDDEGSDNDNEEKSLDIRAGRVGVVLEEIKFDPLKVVEIFEKYRFKNFTCAKSRKNIKEIVIKYRQFAEGEFPLGTKKIETAKTVLQKLGPIDEEEKAKECWSTRRV